MSTRPSRFSLQCTIRTHGQPLQETPGLSNAVGPSPLALLYLQILANLV
jgi:hypothetical protein